MRAGGAGGRGVTLMHLWLGVAGVACVSIPIIIHLLFRRRRKPVLWGAMRFLLEAYRRQRRRLTLEQLLLLLARCAVIVLVALAIGRPLLERAGALGAGGSRTVYLLVDNGLASSARDAEGESALDRHKRAADEILGALGPSDRAGLIALGAPADPLVAPASSDLGAVRSLVDQLAATDSATDLAGASERLRAELAGESARRSREVIVVVLSEFLTGSADVTAALPTLGAGDGAKGAPVRVIATRPAERPASNVQIVAVDPLRSVVLAGDGRAGGADQVRVSLRRTGPAVGEPGSTTLRVRSVTPGVPGGLEAPGGAAAETVVRWSPGQSEATAPVTAPLPVGALVADSGDSEAAAIVAEIDRDSVDGDNVFRRPIAVREELRVGIVTRRRFGAAPGVERLDPADWVRLALRPTGATPIDVVDIEPASIDAPSLAALSAVILMRPDLVEADGWKRLAQFVDTGGLLVVFPPAEPSVHLWTDAMTEALALPWRLAREATTYEPPMKLADEQPRSALLGLVEGEMKDLTAPVSVTKVLAVEQAPSGVETLLALQNNTPLAIAGSAQRSAEGSTNGATPTGTSAAERGLVVYVATAPTLSWTDLPAKPLMLPLLQEIVRQGVGRAHGSWAVTAGGRPTAPGAGRVVELRRLGAPGGERDEAALLVDDAGRTLQPVRKAGLFRAVDGRGVTRGVVAVNADARAGRTDAQATSVVQAWLGAMAGAPGGGGVEWIDTGAGATRTAAAQFAAASDRAGGSPISLPLLIAALLVALAETVMARFFSHAFREEAPGAGVAAGGGA